MRTLPLSGGSIRALERLMKNTLTYSILLAGATMVSMACSSDKDNGRSDAGTDGGLVDTGGTSSSGGGAGGTSTGGTSGKGGTTGGTAGGTANGGSGGTVIRDGGAGAGGTSADAGDAGVVALTDAQILDVVDVANTGEVAQGQVAVTRGVRADVKAFASDMVTQHGASKTMDVALAKQLSLTLAPSSVTVSLKAESDNIVKLLNAAPAASFDQIYIGSQVDVHRAVLLILDKALIPQADAPTLKTFLTTTRATVAMHLAMAESLAGDGGMRDQ
jgi:putative membrane protein